MDFNSIYSEAHLRETKFEVLKEDETLRNLFDKYNALYFEGRLDIDKIGWSHHSSSQRLGAFWSGWDGSWIEISPLLKDFVGTDKFRDVLVHEMIHIEEPSHSLGFIKEMNRINQSYGLHISVTVDEASELADLLADFNKKSLEKRADKINNNKNKPELQKLYDKLNEKYFYGSLTDNIILKYLSAKTFKTYSLSMVRADTDSDWIWELKVNRENTPKWTLKALIYIYCSDVLGLDKKKIEAKRDELEQELKSKTNDFTEI